MATTTEAPMLRWSSVRSCPRKAVLEATLPAERDWTRQEQGYMLRGKSVGRDFVLMLAQGNAEQGKNGLIWVDSGPSNWVPPTMLATKREYAAFIAELRVPWELGQGHADCYVVETDTVIEVLSSVHEAQAHSKLLQGVGYASKLPDAKAVCLVIVDPSDLTESRVIVVRDSPQWDELLDEVNDRIEQVLIWREEAKLPERVCEKPSQARSHWCRHSQACFEGWQAPEADPIDNADAQQLAIQLATVKAKRRELSQSDKLLEKTQKDIQSELAEHVPAGEWQVGGYLVKHSERSRSSFNLTLASKDSRLHPDLLAEFTRTSRYSVFDVEKTGPVMALPDDEGSPF